MLDRIRERIKKISIPYQIRFLREFVAAGAVVACLLGIIATVGGDVEPTAPSAPQLRTPDTMTVSSDALPSSTPPHEEAGEAQVAQSLAERADISLRGLDPIASPEVFDIIDAEEELSLIISHVPNDDAIIRSSGALRMAPSRTSHIVVDKIGHTLTLFTGGELIRQYGIAVGKSPGNKMKNGDNRTPEGTFAITQIHDASTWVHDFGDGLGPIDGAYGPLFIRLATAPWSGIGIHGTHDPDSIGTDATEGCIRMHNEDLVELADMIGTDTTVTIHPN